MVGHQFISELPTSQSKEGSVSCYSSRCQKHKGEPITQQKQKFLSWLLLKRSGWFSKQYPSQYLITDPKHSTQRQGAGDKTGCSKHIGLSCFGYRNQETTQAQLVPHTCDFLTLWKELANLGNQGRDIKSNGNNGKAKRSWEMECYLSQFSQSPISCFKPNRPLRVPNVLWANKYLQTFLDLNLSCWGLVSKYLATTL